MTNYNFLSRKEYCFVNLLSTRLKWYHLFFLTVDRKSDNTLNFCYKNLQIGRIKLEGRKTQMQLLYPEISEVKWFHGSFWDYVESQQTWINLIAFYDNKWLNENPNEYIAKEKNELIKFF